MDRFKLILLILLILTFSCNVEEDIFTNEKPINPEEISEFSNINTIGNQGLSVIPSILDTVDFERFMQWTSYITAQAIMSDPNIRTEVIGLLNGRETIPFSELLEDLYASRSNSNTSLFAAKFMAILTDISRNQSIGRAPGSNHASQTPPEPILECGCGGPFNDDGWVDFFIRTLLNYNCLELYLPNGLRSINGTNAHSLTSTAHPLTNNVSNDGIIHYSLPVAGFISNIVVVDSSYVNNTSYDNVLVVRPYRILGSCTYESYASINFIDFLN